MSFPRKERLCPWWIKKTLNFLKQSLESLSPGFHLKFLGLKAQHSFAVFVPNKCPMNVSDVSSMEKSLQYCNKTVTHPRHHNPILAIRSICCHKQVYNVLQWPWSMFPQPCWFLCYLCSELSAMVRGHSSSPGEQMGAAPRAGSSEQASCWPTGTITSDKSQLCYQV